MLFCLLRDILVCYDFSFYLWICATAKWSIDLQAPSVAHTYHVILLPIQPHFCLGVSCAHGGVGLQYLGLQYT